MPIPDDHIHDLEQDVVQTLVDEHVRASGDLTVVDGHTWAIHGEIAVDGEEIVAEFDSRAAAQHALERLIAAERDQEMSSAESAMVQPTEVGRSSARASTPRDHDAGFGRRP